MNVEYDAQEAEDSCRYQLHSYVTGPPHSELSEML